MFFSLTKMTPVLYLIPMEVYPFATAFKAFSIYFSFPLELKVVNEKSLDIDLNYICNNLLNKF